MVAWKTYGEYFSILIMPENDKWLTGCVGVLFSYSVNITEIKRLVNKGSASFLLRTWYVGNSKCVSLISNN